MSGLPQIINMNIDLSVICAGITVNRSSKRGGSLSVEIESVDADDLMDLIANAVGVGAICDYVGKTAAVQHFDIQEAEDI